MSKKKNTPVATAGSTSKACGSQLRAAISPLSPEVLRGANWIATVFFIIRRGQQRGVYCVSRGLIALRSFCPDGSSSLLRLAYPGELIGYRAFLTGREHRTEAQALLPSRVCVVAHRDAKQVIQACPAVLVRLAERCADELDQCHERIQDAARVPNKQRLAQLLEDLMTAHGKEEGDIWRMRLPISRQDLADILGVQPETLSRLLRRLQDEGLLQSSGRWVEMPRPQRREAS